ncbi:MAG: hypothetical protein QOF14_987 [Hyphomicrobiales bacterium]|nr:hypothetical protein [Hyphomicrobiales bacterium]
MSDQFNCGFGPTITRKTPGLPFSYDIPPERVPSESSNAAERAFRGVSSGLSGLSGILSASRSKSAWLSARRKSETPCGWPPAAIVYGWFRSKRGDTSSCVMCRGSSTLQVACFKKSLICKESWKASPSSRTNKISTGALGLPSRIFKKLEPLICLGRKRSRSCSSFSSASLLRASASAILAWALAISACALPRSAFASAVCNSSADVLHSECCSRMAVVRHCSNRNAIVAQAPMAVMMPPTSTPFQEIGYQYSAQTSRAWAIGEGSEPVGFSIAMVVIIAAPIILLFYIVGAFWRWFPAISDHPRCPPV